MRARLSSTEIRIFLANAETHTGTGLTKKSALVILRAMEASSASAAVRAAGEDREPGENPGRYRRCMRRVPYPLMKISHWETGKAGYAGAGAMLPIREPEDLQKEKHFAIF